MRPAFEHAPERNFDKGGIILYLRRTISILGAGVLYGYAPAISLLLSVLKEFFFVTTGRNSDMGWIAEYGSPIGYYAKLMEAGLRIFHSDQFCIISDRTL